MLDRRISSEESMRGNKGGVVVVNIGANGMVERIRSLLARFPEDEHTVRELAANDAGFDALCQEYENVVKLLAGFELEVERLRQRRASLEEALLTRIEGQAPQ